MLDLDGDRSSRWEMAKSGYADKQAAERGQNAGAGGRLQGVLLLLLRTAVSLFATAL
jgi:hypothetical protein